MSGGFTIKEMSVGMRIFAVIAALLLIIAGILTLTGPIISVFWLVPVVIFIYGANALARYFTMKDMREGWDIVIGIISILFSALIMFYPGTKLYGLVLSELFIAFWAFFAGITKIAGSFSSERKGEKGKAWSITAGVLIIIFALLLVIYPVIGTLALLFTGGMLIGISFVFVGFAGLVTALSGKGFLDKAVKAAEAAAADEPADSKKTAEADATDKADNADEADKADNADNADKGAE